jgi:hypothetical protein
MGDVNVALVNSVMHMRGGALSYEVTQVITEGTTMPHSLGLSCLHCSRMSGYGAMIGGTPPPSFRVRDVSVDRAMARSVISEGERDIVRMVSDQLPYVAWINQRSL